jgi:DNA-binding NarL/FixJ family response regulator
MSRREKKKVLHTKWKLTGQEWTVLRGLALGKSMQEIAAEMKLSHKTVSTYWGRVRKKSGMRSYVEAALWYERNERGPEDEIIDVPPVGHS